jgi:hypothetical protein
VVAPSNPSVAGSNPAGRTQLIHPIDDLNERRVVHSWHKLSTTAEN